ncbi:MAG: hypothetical protein WB792_02330 [Desulfobacterales bacterium]
MADQSENARILIVTPEVTYHVDFDLPLDILNVKIDLIQLQMVLSADLVNASDAMEGEGRIRIVYRN